MNAAVNKTKVFGIILGAMLGLALGAVTFTATLKAFRTITYTGQINSFEIPRLKLVCVERKDPTTPLMACLPKAWTEDDE